MIKKSKIATILPYKENYTFSKAQAAAIWVNDFYKHSAYKNINYIFGNTNTKDFLTKNYINVPIKKKNQDSLVQLMNTAIILLKLVRSIILKLLKFIIDL